jgi:hypothetical protein
MESGSSIEWLKQNGSPSVKYWIALEIEAKGKGNLEELRERAFQSVCSRKWLDLVRLAGVHGSKPSCFENAIPKLAMLGYRPEDTDFMETCQYWEGKIDVSPFQNHDQGLKRETPANLWSFNFMENTIIAGILAYVGFAKHVKIATVINHRLDTLYSAVMHGDFNPVTFYLPADSYARLPKSRRHDVINPAYYLHGDFKLPWIYDILGFVGLHNSTIDAAVRDKIEKIIGFILTPAYQHLTEGYGVVMTRENYGYSLGWSVHVPGFFGFAEGLPSGSSGARLLLLLDILGTFKATRAHPWYHDAIAFLDQYRTDSEQFLFPRAFIDDKAAGYWVSGAYMGMGEDHKESSWREGLSTFWMTKIKIKNRL